MPPPERAVFCNRTLNMRSIRAIGFDMDYTLVHYDEVAWETRAYWHVQQALLRKGHPVADLRFDPQLFPRGLILDLDRGNVVKANRFGYVTMAAHGVRVLPHDEVRRVYSGVWVDLSDKRWELLNTLFSLSEACLYGQMVELFDAGRVQGVAGYEALYRMVKSTMDEAHLEGALKAEIIAAPERFVDLDPLLVQTLVDLKHAGKKLFLATNSEWHYTRAMMGWTFDPFDGGTFDWRDLFDLVIVQAKKPAFFEQQRPFLEVVDDETTREVDGPLRKGAVYKGGNAHAVQEHFGCAGGEILYVGDHVFADVHISSQLRHWRTALVLRELENEVRAERDFAAQQHELDRLMAEKQQLDAEQAALRLALQRRDHGQAMPQEVALAASGIQERLKAIRAASDALDQRILPLVRGSGQVGHPVWGPVMRAGGDKSRLARQIERHADVYTSRVSNFLHLTPFGYLRAHRGSLPHDPPR
ncbi:MAG: HAD-IG family 5'-nucleotidase [Phycisphaerales bacterium]|nr:HAD-IG family 5'-nucleotidase [Phycisphaerales bacterium]